MFGQNKKKQIARYCLSATFLQSQSAQKELEQLKVYDFLNELK